MLGTMRRREDDLLAISPPPEFQDLQISPSASTSSVTPPQDFRDLTPSPSCPPESSVLFSSIHNECNKTVRDFAEKVSFNILNEAMIIATLIPQAGSSTTDFRSHHLSVPSGGKFSSDSYDSSSATSWEYLHEIENLSCFVKPYHLSSVASSRQFKKRSLPKSNSEGSALKSVGMLQMRSGSNTSGPGPGSSGQEQFKRNLLFNQEGQKSQDILTKDESNISDCYTVPYECDIYSLPVDNIPNPKDNGLSSSVTLFPKNRYLRPKKDHLSGNAVNRLSLREFESSDAAGVSGGGDGSRGVKMRNSQRQKNLTNGLSAVGALTNKEIGRTQERNNNYEDNGRSRKKRRSKSIETENHDGLVQSKSSQAITKPGIEVTEKEKRSLGSSFLKLFRRTRPKSNHLFSSEDCSAEQTSSDAFPSGRALPLPPPLVPDDTNQSLNESDESNFEPLTTHLPVDRCNNTEPRDFAARIEKVKDCGWYWGPLDSQSAEDLLRGEPDGSFVVRDSSDPHYIFSLTFKLNGLIRHVRIEHDQGNFSFGPLTRFKAATIVQFIEKAVQHSRSGRFLFFLHRRPTLGPMRVQLLHPYSRFVHPRSLQHMCRFVILKYVRRDLINSLPLPNPLLEYLNTPQYYFENKDVPA